MSYAFEDLFGVADAFAGAPMAGRTDSWILTDALTAHGIDGQDPRVSRYREVYFRHLERELLKPPPSDKRHGIMPGVRPLLDELASRDAAFLALLTGNYETAARMKLEYFDLWRYFACGAFGDEAPDRNGLLARALASAKACGAPAVDPRQTVIIGDTPLDIAVALSGGARSIGVATGGYGAAALLEAGADVVFEDMSDTAAVLDAILR
jgi:phosphoglycolate phosphatase-like HAD superfamily hydrolase